MNQPLTAASFQLVAATQRVTWPEHVEAVFASLSRRRGCLWLDSAGGPAHLARWSVLSSEPVSVLSWEEARDHLSPGKGLLPPVARDPFAMLRETLAATSLGGNAWPSESPFGPGFYGYLSYDLAPHVEPSATLSPVRDVPLPDLWFGLYDCVLVLDHLKHEAFLVGSAGSSREALQEALADGAQGLPAPGRVSPDARVVDLCYPVSREAYLEAVARARQYIAAGDIYQVNLSRRLTATLHGDDPTTRLASLYLRLRRANPAPYAAYIGLADGRAVLSSSPELFLDLCGGRVVTRPIKGTRPLRPGDDAFNRRMRQELLASAKDRAELVMIVDLERNDLGRLCSYGTVRVTEPRALEAYAAVHHTVATVEGRLHDGHDVVDLLRATFPGGSITGAPKVRAMQIIAELEPVRRSVYTGAIGYLGPATPTQPAGRCILNVAIRTFLAVWPQVHVQVGGGIVADSQPEAEFDETLDKARAMMAALGLDT